jgi:hypothetical protein
VPITRSLDLKSSDDAADNQSHKILASADIDPAPNFSDPRFDSAERDRASALEAALADRSKSHRQRARAARALGRQRRESSAEALYAALEDSCPAVRQAAIIALGEVGGVEAASRLEGLLDSNSRYIRRIAAIGLLKISGVPEAKPENMGLLEKLLSSKDERVVEALLDIGPNAIDLLRSRITDGPLFMRQNTAQALAMRIRQEMGNAGPEDDLFFHLGRKGISKSEIAGLYLFKAARQDGRVIKVENTGFGLISEILRFPLKITFSDDPHPDKPYPAPTYPMQDEVPQRAIFDDLLENTGAKFQKMMGRTLISILGPKFLAIKLCAKAGDEAGLITELSALRHLRSMHLSSDLPEPIGGMLEIEGLPAYVRKALGREKTYAICYTCSRDYLTYLNDPRLSPEELLRGFGACSGDLGVLAGSGAIHTSLIPLYHKREILTAENGNGARSEGRRYAWWRNLAGNLDSWAKSCRYPNLRLSGIADFEHIEFHNKISSQDLQVKIGEGLLSMSLVLGSYFRNMGSFDRHLMARAIEEIFCSYCAALTGKNPSFEGCIDWQELGDRMAEEMEGDRYMTETIRDKLVDGPHLGVFNGPFPVPELIRAIHIASLFAVLELRS